ncbi:hypothetical protein M422DRAFT_239326 [Sphaerobolus stellatus SS14]|nr:hypothetical protein M422DRAFT_239326 [Sphaerobolus stellatus SS14]
MADSTTIKEDIDLNACSYSNVAAIDTVTTVMILVSDAAVTVITIYFAFREDTSRSFREVFRNSLTPLTITFVRQGLIRFLIILFWTIEESVNDKVLPYPLTGIDANIEIAISVILICRFLLELRTFTERAQSVPSVHIATLSGIQGQLSRLNASIIQEFGKSGIKNKADCDLEGGAPTHDEGKHASLPANSTDTELGISEEYPWAITAEEV